MTAITHNCAQGSDEWRALRAKYLTASEASAALGASKYQKRSDLIKAKATGIVADVSEGTQFLFDKGHQAESAARPVVESQLGEELFPVTMSREVDGLPLLASLDGITMMGDIIWETKLLNESLKDDIQQGQLHNHYAYQIEQQLLVSGAEKCYFTTSDGTPEGTFGMWYSSCPEIRAALLAGWKQFQIDVAAYVPEEVKPKAEGVAPDALPALRIEVTGMVTASNLEQFKTAALSVFRGINTSLQTDQDFASAEKAVKFCKDAEERLEAAKDHALSQTESIDALFKTIDAIKEEARTVRLKLDKLVKAEKESRKAELVAATNKAANEHYAALAARVGVQFSVATVSFASEIAGLKSLASMKEKLSVALANAKVEANAIADRIEANRKTVEDMTLFPDFHQVCAKLPEDFAALMAMRIGQRQARLDAERERIRAEEQAKAQREAAEALARKNAEANPTNPAVVEKPVCVEQMQKSETQPVLTVASETQAAVQTIKLGEINTLLGCVSVTADQLASLGIHPVATDKNAKLYDANKFPTICRLISEAVMEKAFKKAA